MRSRRNGNVTAPRTSPGPWFRGSKTYKLLYLDVTVYMYSILRSIVTILPNFKLKVACLLYFSNDWIQLPIYWYISQCHNNWCDRADRTSPGPQFLHQTNNGYAIFTNYIDISWKYKYLIITIQNCKLKLVGLHYHNRSKCGSLPLSWHRNRRWLTSSQDQPRTTTLRW